MYTMDDRAEAFADRYIVLEPINVVSRLQVVSSING
jgi:hypothetical protein